MDKNCKACGGEVRGNSDYCLECWIEMTMKQDEKPEVIDVD